MNTSSSTNGRISDHAHGMGSVTPDMINRRARELAVINGRENEKFTEADWLQAKRELSGQEAADKQIEEPIAGLTTWNERPHTDEHRVANSPSTEDDETVAEQLTREGMEEANHDLMLNASRATKE